MSDLEYKSDFAPVRTRKLLECIVNTEDFETFTRLMRPITFHHSWAVEVRPILKGMTTEDMYYAISEMDNYWRNYKAFDASTFKANSQRLFDIHWSRVKADRITAKGSKEAGVNLDV